MAYYNGFPATYPGAYSQGYPAPQMPVYGQQGPNNGYQSGTFQNGNTQPMQQPQQQPTPMMTPPTIRAEIIQIDDEGWENYVDRFPLGPGASQMFMTRSEGNIIIKSMGQTGPLPLVIFDKRPPEPPAPVFDPGEFVRKDEFNERLNAILDALEANQKEEPAQTAQIAPRRAAKKEVE